MTDFAVVMSRTILTSTFLLCAVAAPMAHAQQGPDIVVNAPGGAIDADEARGLDARALDASAHADLARALERAVPGLSLGDASGNPWQAAINWRGFSVSALQGAEQGMAVYLDGVRFNQPFGDVVLLDLLPESALVSAQVNDANPVLGRNALAGSLLLQTGDGVSLGGMREAVDIDSIGSVGSTFSMGRGDAADNLLIATELRHDKGWRVDSPSNLMRGFAKAIHRGTGWGAELSALGADTDLTGNGVAPVELLQADWRAVFTRPDTTRTGYVRLVAAPWVETSETGRLELRAYWQHISRRSANGDLADFGACEDDAAHLCVAEDGGGFADPLLSSGTPVAIDPAVARYAVYNRGRERTGTFGATLQWLDERATDAGTRRIALGMAWEQARTQFQADSELGMLEADRSVTAFGLPIATADGAITPVDVISRSTDLALFASAGVPITRSLGVEAGARLSRNRVVLEDRIGTALNGSHRFTRLNPSIELDYAAPHTLKLTAGFALTSRNPTPAELSCADAEAPCTLANFFIADPPLKVVTARNWHGGVSGGHAPGLSWRINAWRADTRNDIRMIAAGLRGRAYFANLGATRRQGMEVSVDWQRDGWVASASYGFTDARFREGFRTTSPQNPQADANGLITVSPGSQLPGVPRHAFNLRLARETRSWSAGVALRARSGQFLLGDEGNGNPRTPAYAVFDLDGRVALTPGIEVVAQLRNLFDRHYVTFGTFAAISDIALTEALGASDPRAYAPATPRRLTVSLRTRF
ncbi:MAG: hypothetical protein RIS94_1330 [Pseudomonadota bacterium]